MRATSLALLASLTSVAATPTRRSSERRVSATPRPAHSGPCVSPPASSTLTDVLRKVYALAASTAFLAVLCVTLFIIMSVRPVTSVTEATRAPSPSPATSSPCPAPSACPGAHLM